MSRIRVVPVGAETSSGEVVSEKPLHFPYFLQVKHQTQNELLHPVDGVVSTALNEADEIQLKQGLLIADAAEEAQQITPYESGMQEPVQLRPRIGPIGLEPEVMKPLTTSKPLPKGTLGEEYDPRKRPQRLTPLKPTPISTSPLTSTTSTKLSPDQQQKLKEQAKQQFITTYRTIYQQDPPPHIVDEVVPKLVDMSQTLFNVKK